MNPNPNERLSEEQIDEVVIAEAEDDSAWEEAVLVRRSIPITISLPPEVATRAAFLAQLHQVSSAEEWIRNIIQQRIDFEEAAFTKLRQALASQDRA